MKVCIADLGDDRLKAAAAKLSSAAPGGAADIMTAAVDVSRADAVAELEAGVAKRFGGTDILMNNAGIQPGSAMFGPADNWQRILGVNLWGVINGTQDGLHQAFRSGEWMQGFEIASMLLGCAVGAFSAGRLADRLGRRNVLILSAVMFLLSALGAGAAVSSAWFIAARVVGGFAVGAASVISPAYIAEVAPARYRGRLATVQQIAIIGGLFAAFLSNYLLARVAGGSTAEFWGGYQAWRWMFWIEIAPAALFLVALFAIPESPRFLVARGRLAQAERVLVRLYGDAAGRRKLEEIRQSLAADQHRPKFSDLVSKVTGRVRPIVWVGIGLAVFQQLVGINVVFYYGAVLWQAVGFSENDALLINVLSGALSIGACIVSLLLVDRIGRKPLLWIGSAGMAVTLAAVTAAFATGTLADDGRLLLSDSMGVLALVAAWLNTWALLMPYAAPASA